MSHIVDWEDRNTAVLFGDGAGAVVLEATDGPGSLLGFDLGSDGSARHILYADLGGYHEDGRQGGLPPGRARRRVQRHEHAGARRGRRRDIALVVPHQANVRIIDSAWQRLGIPPDRTASVLDRTGNTSSASIPIALVEAVEQDRLATGDLVLLVGFGAGMSWASRPRASGTPADDRALGCGSGGTGRARDRRGQGHRPGLRSRRSRRAATGWP